MANFLISSNSGRILGSRPNFMLIFEIDSTLCAQLLGKFFFLTINFIIERLQCSIQNMNELQT